MILAVTRSVEETRALAAALAELARPGDIMVLAGDLGAGKTAFAQGFGAELGVTERMTSPGTFCVLPESWHCKQSCVCRRNVGRVGRWASV